MCVQPSAGIPKMEEAGEENLMNRPGLIAALIAVTAIALFAQRPAFNEFEVAVIKPAPSDSPGRYIRMQSTNRFFAKGMTLKQLVAAAYSLNPKEIFGGPEWTDTDHYDTVAKTPGQVEPNPDEQMAMLRKLLADRFQLAFHREQKEMPIYALTVAKSGPKLQKSTAPVDEQPYLITVVLPDHLRLPARNATIGQFAATMRHAWLDRPVVDRTGISGRYDFVLEWTPDETQFGGELHLPANPDNPEPDLFAAVQQQLGLRLEATRGPTEILVIDRVKQPSEN